MAKIRVGCAGWDYKDWNGPFYPKDIDKSHHLEFYAKYFDVVEINSTFYNLPTEEMVYKWVAVVPEKFSFIVKVWQKITHNLNDPDLEDKIAEFFYRLKPLENKTILYLLQFPPWFNYSEQHLKLLKYLLNQIPRENHYVLELRDNAWFNLETLSEFVDGSRIILGATYMPNIVAYYFPNQNHYYIRLIGDRQLTIFNRIQRDQREALDDLYHHIQILMQNPEIEEIFVIVNNHFRGFAPESAILIKKQLNLPVRDFNKQKSLLDF